MAELNRDKMNKLADKAIATKNPFLAGAGTAVKVGNTVNNNLSSMSTNSKFSSSKKQNSTNVPNALKSPNPDNSVTGKQNNHSNNYGGNKQNEGLAKKDGLDKKEGLDGNKKKEENKSNSKGNSESKKSGVNLLGDKNPLQKLKSIKKKLIIIGIIAAAYLSFLAIAYCIIVFSTILTAITSFFGIKDYDDYTVEKSETNGAGGIWVEDKYFVDANGEQIGLKDYTYPDGHTVDGIITVLENDNACNANTIVLWFDNLLTSITGNFAGNPCRLLNYIRGTANGYERKYSQYGLDVDESLIISTFFNGYDEQASYTSYKNTDDVEVVTSTENYNRLENMLTGGDEALISKEDVDKLVRSTIFEDVWPYWSFEKVATLLTKKYLIQASVDVPSTDTLVLKKALVDELLPLVPTNSTINDILWYYDLTTLNMLVKDIQNGKTDIEITVPKLQGRCVAKSHIFYYSSVEKWELFMRFSDIDPTSSSGESIPGYIGSGGLGSKPILDRSIPAFASIKSIYGSGWVYDTDMNNSYINTDDICKGTVTPSSPEEYEVDSFGDLSEGANFYASKGVSGTQSTYAYFQKVRYEELYSLNKDIFVSLTRKNSSADGTGTSVFDFDYRNGYAYINFPGFKTADEDDNLPGYVYDEITTPKRVEVSIQTIKEDKDNYDYILETEKKEPAYNSGSGFSVLSYCKYAQENDISKTEIIINDCEGNYMTTRSFKEYIIGVVLGEISVSSNAEYIKTQMVASISYTLGRGGNLNKSKVLTMRSGDCDQNYCDPYLGCSRSYDGGFVMKGIQYPATYPNEVENPVTKATCTTDGVIKHGFYNCPLGSSDMARLSDLFEEAKRYVVGVKSVAYEKYGVNYAEDVKGAGFNGSYKSVTQNTWSSMAGEGLSFVEILKKTYSGSTIYDCKDVANYGGD